MKKMEAWGEDMDAEVAFLRGLGVDEAGDGNGTAGGGWGTEIKETIKGIKRSHQREKVRERMVFSVRDVERVEKARKEKIRRAQARRREET